MRIFIALFIALFIVTGASFSHAGNGRIDLLEGDSLDKWYIWIQNRGRNDDPKDVFVLKDGVLRISGEEMGCITTNEEYENYHLTLDYKWGEKTYEPRLTLPRDSGLLIHSFGKDGDYQGIWMNSLEIQMIEGSTGDFIIVGDGTDTYYITAPVAPEKLGGFHVTQLGGELFKLVGGGHIKWIDRDPDYKNVLGFRGKKDVENPHGAWNRLEVIAEGGKITALLNGNVVNRAVDCSPQKGLIQIQSEAAELFVRNVYLTPLDQPKVDPAK